MWFPANYVEEIESVEDTSDSLPLGSLQKGTIDLTGVTVGMQNCSVCLWLIANTNYI